MSVLRVSRLALACAALLSGSLYAQIKVGVINSQKALVETAEIKKAQAELEAKFKPRQDALDKISAEVMRILKEPEVLTRLNDLAFVPAKESRQEFEFFALKDPMLNAFASRTIPPVAMRDDMTPKGSVTVGGQAIGGNQNNTSVCVGCSREKYKYDYAFNRCCA